MKNIKFIFIGTSEFAAIILEYLIKNQWTPSLTITQPDKKIGRKQVLSFSPVKIIANKYNIKLLQPSEIKKSLSIIKNIAPDIIIVASYGQILPKEILEIPKYGCINAHASLLPLYRGSSPIQESILKGDKKTGITIIKMDNKIDHGPILNSIKIPIDKNDTFKTLMKKLSNKAGQLIIKTIPKYINGQIKPRAQDEKRKSYTKIIDKKNGKISWNKKAEEIIHQVAAYNPWPGTYTFWQNKIIKIIEADIYSNNFNLEPGRVFKTEKNQIAVATKEKALLIKKIQLEGKKVTLSQEFLKGYPQIIGYKF